MTFPNVPNLPGVPNLLRAAGSAENKAIAAIAPLLLTADAILNLGFKASPIWGVYFNGTKVFFTDNCVSVEYKNDWNIAAYPIEGGLFASYDKVQTPFTTKVRISAGGSLRRRTDLLSQVAYYAGGTYLLQVITPEETYNNVSISHYDYRRSAKEGAGLIEIDLWLVQVRVAPSPALSNTVSPNSAPQNNGGVVAPAAAPNPPHVEVSELK